MINTTYRIVSLLFCLMAGAELFAQWNVPGIVHARIINAQHKPPAGSTTFNEPGINALLAGFSITSVADAFPGVITIDHPNAEPLSRVLLIACNCNEKRLDSVLTNHGGAWFDHIELVWRAFPTASDPVAAPAALRIWPQPCREQLNVENLYPQAAYTLSDMQGRALRSGQWPQPGPQQIDTGGLPSGVYLLEVQGSGRRAQIKVLLQ